MSYDVRLHDANGNTLDLGDTFTEGGTFAVGGTTECELNITYNYSEVFGPLVRNLHGRVAEDTLPALREFCERWHGARPYTKDYWAPTPGNALKAIARLVAFAEKHPTGIWSVT